MRMRRRTFLLSALAAGVASPALVTCGPSRRSPASPWGDILARLPADQAGRIAEPAHEVQAIYTRIDRDESQQATLTTFPLQLAPDRWFTAASWVKLPAVLLTAERLTQLGTDADARLVLEAPPATGNWDTGEPLDEPFVRTVRRLFTVSENAPFNRLYEYLGQAEIAAALAAHGYPAWIIARLGSQDVEAHRTTGTVSVLSSDGALLERRQRRTNPGGPLVPLDSAVKGQGWQTNEGQLVPGPHDFRYTNFIPLQTMHDMLTALVFPDRVTPAHAWAIAPAMRRALLTELARWPRESPDPRYDAPEYVDGYAKFFVVGDRPAAAPPGLRLFSKSGQAYGYLQDSAYLVDRDAGVECLLSATIHANADGVYNDDRYEYDSIAIPFLAALGRAVLEHERARPRRVRPAFADLPWPGPSRGGVLAGTAPTLG